MAAWTRKFAPTLLAAAIGLVSGCGKNEPAPQAKVDPGTPSPKPATPTDPPKTPVDPPPPKPPADPWEMDVAKQKIPDQPLAGRIMGEAFAPDVFLVGNSLIFQAQKGDDRTDVTLKLSPKLLEAARKGAPIRIASDAAAGPEVPEITATIPAKPNPVLFVYPAGYALTLEFGKKDKGKVDAKVYLTLPEEEHRSLKHRNYLAGTFTTDWQRSPDQPPGDEEVPFVQGKFTVEGKTNPSVKVGAVGIQPSGQVTHDGVDTILTGGISSRVGDAALFAEAGKEGVGRYEFARMIPGRYFVYGMLKDGPFVGKWISIDPASRESIDLVLKESEPGSLEVTLPLTEVDKVRVVPAEAKLNATAASAIGLILGTAEVPKDGVVKFEKLPPGKYDVWSTEKLGSIEVKSGGTAKLDTTKKDAPEKKEEKKDETEKKEAKEKKDN